MAFLSLVPKVVRPEVVASVDPRGWFSETRANVSIQYCVLSLGLSMLAACRTVCPDLRPAGPDGVPVLEIRGPDRTYWLNGHRAGKNLQDALVVMREQHLQSVFVVSEFKFADQGCELEASIRKAGVAVVGLWEAWALWPGWHTPRWDSGRECKFDN